MNELKRVIQVTYPFPDMCLWTDKLTILSKDVEKGPCAICGSVTNPKVCNLIKNGQTMGNCCFNCYNANVKCGQ